MCNILLRHDLVLGVLGSSNIGPNRNSHKSSVLWNIDDCIRGLCICFIQFENSHCHHSYAWYRNRLFGLSQDSTFMMFTTGCISLKIQENWPPRKNSIKSHSSWTLGIDSITLPSKERLICCNKFPDEEMHHPEQISVSGWFTADDLCHARGVNHSWEISENQNSRIVRLSHKILLKIRDIVL